VLANLIQGNQAGAGDGGGIRTQFVNGTDVLGSPDSSPGWYSIFLNNNIVVDNMAALAGGGISLQDTARVFITHNTVANNDSTATAGAAFAPDSANQSTAQPAGIVSREHSSALAAAFGNTAGVQAFKVFSNPTLRNNIVWHNRSFYWEIDDTTVPATFGLKPVVNPDGTGAVFWDFAVLGTEDPACLDPRRGILTTLNEHGCTYHATNSIADPLFMAEYYNGAPGQTILLPETTTSLATAPAFDEGGNFIDVRFGPLTLYTITDPLTGAQGPAYGDYHLQDGSPAEGRGVAGLAVSTDFDGESRPNPVGTNPDAGADERL
jgi:parallel beta-helix repeat protein